MMLRLYELAWRPAAAVIARTDAMTAHARTVSLLRTADFLRHAEAEWIDVCHRIAEQVGGGRLMGDVAPQVALETGSGITILGAIVLAGTSSWLATVLGFLAVVFATVNVVGGFTVTHRMLKMFKSRG